LTANSADITDGFISSLSVPSALSAVSSLFSPKPGHGLKPDYALLSAVESLFIGGFTIAMKLSFAQKRHLFDQGYVHIPGVIPRIMIDEALRTINHYLGEGVDRTQLATLRARSFVPEGRDHPSIAALYNKTPARDLMESAMAPGKIQPVERGQIALRFPTCQDPLPPHRPHLDGMSTPHNGTEAGTIDSFTALIGVFLNDLPRGGAGNFVVWPGTHRLHEAYFKEHGPLSLLNGMPPIALPEPVELTGNAGDIVIAHYLTAHAGSENTSPHIRYGIFFRLSHVDLEAHGVAPMADAWSEWDGMRETFQV
jgi:hypothetical protein